MALPSHRILGLMSGTSVDGIDLALAEFNENGWKFIKAKTYPYDGNMRKRLNESMEVSAVELTKLHFDLGHHYGHLCRQFLEESNESADYIASHGHTVFHQPEHGITLQIGHAGAIACISGVPTISDFRSQDVALGGQGAPLVPKGDKDLFSEYKVCLNLGGITNLSFQDGVDRIAGDVCFCNMALNEVARRTGKEYDEDGILASSGKPIKRLYEDLEQLEFFKSAFPKSTGKEWFDEKVKPLLDKKYSPNDTLATLCDFISTKIADQVNLFKEGKVLISGGGANNKHLVGVLSKKLNPRLDIILPESSIVDFREAIIFAYLGYLRVKGTPSTVKTATGARKEVSAGCLYLPY
ncbi:anhydro-N-acetylmuramic acid kinase-like [Artemia franciscana]|uniref:anhydro-N-acetylmuramic acid kinase-like n=1 Tax=Artemia franciscana TaxID=6661 RepID=UPI0032DB5600